MYEIPCNDCTSTYVGETMQWLQSRLAQHRSDVKLKRKSTALCDHTTEKGHSFDFDKTKIVCFEENEQKRKMREAIEIVKRGNTAVNFKTDSCKMSNTYSPILRMRQRHD